MGPAEPPQREGRLPSMPATNYWNSNRSLTSSKHWASLHAPKTSTSQSSTYTRPFSSRNPTPADTALFTAFAEPQPTLMPDVDATLHLIAQWKHIITTDLTSAFYQIPLSRNSMKYCGVATPF
ncbi:hypothetical protein P5673_010009 [Acropora cervicornis]|uniref:Uncharacterized protein n=1 Tax=Acropora cervicornis TaxID=6130 RepID=A0AAD9QSV3_ACRCE|nr:hypothetical protein P5673_010009 [Acropora cervicornis]